MNENIEKRIIPENPLGAFLMREGFTVRAIRLGNTVLLEAEGQGLTDAIQRYYNNEPVPIQSYLAAFQSLRSLIQISKSQQVRQ